MKGSECVQVIAEEILKGQILGLSEPLSYSGITIVPIVRVRDSDRFQKPLRIAKVSDTIPNVIIGSLPRNTCGILVLDSLGDVLAFKVHQDVHAFWKRIGFVEKLVIRQYRETRKPLGKTSATTITISFLMRLKMMGPKGIMNSESDYFAVSRTDIDKDSKDIDLLATTSVVLYCAAS